MPPRPRNRLWQERWNLTSLSSLYGGEVTVDFNSEATRNRYKVTDNGVLLKPAPPSVTTITALADFGKSSALCAWGVKMCLEVLRERIKPDQIHGAEFLEAAFLDAQKNYRDVKKAAADVGTSAHYYLERWSENDPDFAPPLAGTPVRACFDSALDWLNARQITKICAEERVYSRKHNYIGTLDNLSLVDNVVSILDWKAAKHVYASYVMQLAAYVKAREEEHPSPVIQQAIVLQLGEEGARPFIFDRQQIEEAFESFLGLLNLYRWEKKLGKLKPAEKSWLESL